MENISLHVFFKKADIFRAKNELSDWVILNNSLWVLFSCISHPFSSVVEKSFCLHDDELVALITILWLAYNDQYLLPLL